MENTHQVQIHGKIYTVNKTEFNLINTHMTPLQIRDGLGFLDREISLLNRLTDGLGINLVCIGMNHGGFVEINLGSNTSIFCTEQEAEILVSNGYTGKINQYFPTAILRCINPVIVTVNNTEMYPIVIAGVNTKILGIDDYVLYNFVDRKILVRPDMVNSFLNNLGTSSVNGNDITYDNLLNLLIMVKNAGDNFENILRQNLPYIDRWTILDTGSTDNTISIIEKVLKSSGKPGTLYQEPFINFRDSRNRLLELAGKSCAFNIMLDDSYVITGKLREFLTLVRGDDFADSYSLYITELPQDDTRDEEHHIVYSSNRITKPDRNLKYIYTIHEIIESNNNMLIPRQEASLIDYYSPFMKDRTFARKQRDLDLLFAEYERDPANPRTMYYIAETYLCMNDRKNAFVYYQKRSEMDGYVEEKYDSLYKMAVIMEETFLDWEKAHELYLRAYNYHPGRSEGLFMIGKKYASLGMNSVAFMYLKKAWETGYPKNENMNLKVYIHDFYVPYYLLPLCYEFKDFSLGESCAIKALAWLSEQNNSQTFYRQVCEKWLDAFRLLKTLVPTVIPRENKKNRVVFVAPGGWDRWDGQTYYQKGLGGSETFVVRYAEKLAQLGYKTEVFCNCGKEKVYNNVSYIPLEQYGGRISAYGPEIVACFVNRYPAYLFPSTEKISNVYLVLHDLVIPSELIPTNIKKILCISDWHKNHVLEYYPQFTGKVDVISYGINIEEFPVKKIQPGSFIYSSFPNRGLVHLLEMFPKITEKFPWVKLDIFCDLNHPFAWKHNREDMEKIIKMVGEQKNVYNHGWVNGEKLREYWGSSHIWFYPCSFLETCCLTAYEAGASQTVVITDDLAGLKESVGNRGIVIPVVQEQVSELVSKNIPYTEEWREKALEKVYGVLSGQIDTAEIVERNWQFMRRKHYDIVVRDFCEKYVSEPA